MVGGSSFIAQINGLTPTTNYDQILVTGTVNLTGATLAPLTGSFIPNPAVLQTITWIDNNGSADAVVGAFNGLPEGASVTLNGQNLYVSYAGGDGNDVVLSRQPLVQGTALADTFVLTGNGTTFTVTRTNTNGTVTATFTSNAATGVVAFKQFIGGTGGLSRRITTTSPIPGLTVTNVVTIAIGDPEFDGSFQVTAISGNSFDYVNSAGTNTAAAVASGGAVNQPTFTGNGASFAVTNRQLTATTATLTFGTATGVFVPGQPIAVNVGDPLFDGNFIVTSATSTTVTYARTIPGASAFVASKQFLGGTNRRIVMQTPIAGLTVPNFVTIATGDGLFNGTFQVTAVSGNSFDYAAGTAQGAAAAVASGGTVGLATGLMGTVGTVRALAIPVTNINANVSTTGSLTFPASVPAGTFFVGQTIAVAVGVVSSNMMLVLQIIAHPVVGSTTFELCKVTLKPYQTR